MSNTKRSCNCSDAEGCGSVNRRDFLRVVGLGTAALTAAMPAMAGPFEAADFGKVARRRQKALGRMDPVVVCPGNADRLSRRRTGKDRHARRRHLHRPGVSRRRRQALALGRV